MCRSLCGAVRPACVCLCRNDDVGGAGRGVLILVFIFIYCVTYLAENYAVLGSMHSQATITHAHDDDDDALLITWEVCLFFLFFLIGNKLNAIAVMGYEAWNHSIDSRISPHQFSSKTFIFTSEFATAHLPTAPFGRYVASLLKKGGE